VAVKSGNTQLVGSGGLTSGGGGGAEKLRNQKKNGRDHIFTHTYYLAIYAERKMQRACILIHRH
jgi:hypothetical protein